jgi:hypothetical protein
METKSVTNVMMVIYYMMGTISECVERLVPGLVRCRDVQVYIDDFYNKNDGEYHGKHIFVVAWQHYKLSSNCLMQLKFYCTAIENPPL